PARSRCVRCSARRWRGWGSRRAAPARRRSHRGAPAPTRGRARRRSRRPSRPRRSRSSRPSSARAGSRPRRAAARRFGCAGGERSWTSWRQHIAAAARVRDKLPLVHRPMDRPLDARARAGGRAMYLRFLRLQVIEGQEAAFTRFYQEQVLPALAATPGCLYAALLAPWRSEAHQSLTVWATAEHAAAYEAGATYPRLLAQAAPMLADRAEWRVRLSRDPEETLDPTRREPLVEGFQVETAAGAEALAAERPPFVRVVVVRVATGRVREFVAIYRDEVIPALGRVPGCRGVFLADSI